MSEYIETIYVETKNELIDKIVKSLQLEPKNIRDTIELYYDCQNLRKMHANKERTEAPLPLTQWLAKWLTYGEKVIHGKLEHYITGEASSAEAKWAYAQTGIGPVIACGLEAYINVERADTPSSVWKYAGLAPGFDKRVKGAKLPYNAKLKVLCWKMGDCFVKNSGRPEAFYGQLYRQFKGDEVSRNTNGLYREAARRELQNKKWGDNVTKRRLESGMLSDAHLDARARRRTVKAFLVHYWKVGRQSRGLHIREPYAIGVLKHDGYLPGPNGE